jgi:hypothetical protein
MIFNGNEFWRLGNENWDVIDPDELNLGWLIL